ncbi:siroheme decarboxylase subunit beta [Cupriavidus taiwanensis]|uniref:siroheme decarboxylase n=1 Tax=Cupriavidus taiwanensis TaxID=164546 RepID=A0A375J731_9BURK|nr:AsnC family transcriptional regulator [Cupriavidus taiwanensis]SPS00985.1 Nitrite reductase heme d1 biosynthesis protein [Cupriavidus taiwanensis]
MPTAADAADPTDLALIRATQAGLPLVSAPYAAVAAELGLTEAQVIARLAAMQARGVLRRIAAVPNHYRIGWRANGMTVWDVDDADIDGLGARIGALPFVSHCYRRPRRLPHWRYNLFAMVHARSREEAAPQIAAIAALLGDACRAHDVLWSTRVLKKTGLRLAPADAHTPPDPGPERTHPD